MSQDKCGKCLEVTNVATGASVKTRVVDLCGFDGVDMDPKGEWWPCMKGGSSTHVSCHCAAAARAAAASTPLQQLKITCVLLLVRLVLCPHWLAGNTLAASHVSPTCALPPLLVSLAGFNAIDTDQNGMRDGNMNVRLSWC
jgi:hypothetical protein